MKKQVLTIATTLLLSFGAASAKNPMVGGQAMFENKNIIQNAVKSADHTTLPGGGEGGMSTVTIANVMQSNGVIHVVDSVVLPN